MWNNFKRYFQVSNQYVVGKLKVWLFFLVKQLLLCPFGSKSWKRARQINEDGSSFYLPPRQDINAPDLYIPIMAIFTYIVFVGFSAGFKGQFSPQLISSSLSACFVAIILEVSMKLLLNLQFLVLRLILYLISCPVALLDLLALISYKFFGQFHSSCLTSGYVSTRWFRCSLTRISIMLARCI